MSFIRYPIAIEPDQLRVIVPDFPGCVGTGGSIGAAMDRAQAAMAKRIKELVSAGLPVPAPSMMVDVEADPAHAGRSFGLIMADVSLWRPEVVH